MKRKTQITASLGVLINREGKVLLTLRSDPENKELHHKWEIPGGQIEFGETPEDAVVREMREETGHIVKVKQLIPYIYTKVWHNSGEDVHVILLSFLCDSIRVIGEPQSSEIAAKEWYSKGELDTLDALAGVKEIIDAAI